MQQNTLADYVSIEIELPGYSPEGFPLVMDFLTPLQKLLPKREPWALATVSTGTFPSAFVALSKRDD